MIDYHAVARSAITELIRREHAVLWLEVEAKLADGPYPGITHRGIDPHHLTRGRASLLTDGTIEERSDTTRGGGTVTVFVLRERGKRKTAVDKAAQRKRLLQARYLSWTRATQKMPNAIGEAGERVVHSSLAEAAAAGVGYRLLKTGRDDVTQLFGQPVPGGPLDNAAYLIADDNQGLPVTTTVLIEVKNIRHWIYPSHHELYQLLHKAAQLQITLPNQRFLPVFVCRRAHYWTFLLAKALGFVVFYLPVQPILPHSEIDSAGVEEVKQELGYNLLQTDSSHPYLVKAFRSNLPKKALEVSELWSQNANDVIDFASQLRDDTISRLLRNQLSRELQAMFREMGPDEESEWEPEVEGDY
jgi:hypothetical protein